jgi:hypothetical protein
VVISQLVFKQYKPPVQWIRGLYRGKERPGRDVDPSSPFSAVVMKE